MKPRGKERRHAAHENFESEAEPRTEAQAAVDTDGWVFIKKVHWLLRKKRDPGRG